MLPPFTQLSKPEMKEPSSHGDVTHSHTPTSNHPNSDHLNCWIFHKAVFPCSDSHYLLPRLQQQLPCWSSLEDYFLTALNILSTSQLAEYCLLICCMTKWNVSRKHYCIPKYDHCLEENHICSYLHCKLTWLPFHGIQFLFESTNEL